MFSLKKVAPWNWVLVLRKDTIQKRCVGETGEPGTEMKLQVTHMEK